MVDQLKENGVTSLIKATNKVTLIIGEKSKELDIKLEGYFKELGLDCKNLFKSKDGE